MEIEKVLNLRSTEVVKDCRSGTGVREKERVKYL